MSIEANTPNRNYPLPHEDNKTAFDVLRLIAALTAIDVDMATALIGLVSKAPLASPAFTGTPTAPTQTFGNDSNALATTAFVRAPVAALVNSSPATLDTLNELAAALGNDANFAATMTAALATKANASAVVAKADAGLLSGFRNHLMNGDFWLGNNNNGWGTLTAAQDGKFVGDRWKLTISPATGTTTTISQQSHVVGETLVPGGDYFFLRIDRTATGAGDLHLNQRIERVQPLAGKKVTLTYYVKGTAGKQVEASYAQNFGTGGSPSAAVTGVIQANIPITAAWVKQTHVFNLPSVSGKILGTSLNNYLEIKFKLPAAQGNMSFDISHVSLVEGDASQDADPFSPRNTVLERLMCQRYFWKNAPGDNLMQGHVTTSGSGVYMHFRHPVQMRANPTMTVTFATSGNIGTPVIDRISNRAFIIGATGTSTGGAYSIDTSSDLIADAEF